MQRSSLPLLLIGGFALPLLTFALDYHDATARYSDAPFNRAESAAVSLLTNLGVVSGYPDGTFHPEWTLNRAEFLKIAFLSRGTIAVSPSDSDHCFPDVKEDQWFSRYVCLAKIRGVVKGYPDGMFHPERMVHYLEALKILGELYVVKLSWEELPPTTQREREIGWYIPYREAAEAAGVQLPGGGPPGGFLKRGEMARLTAAYRANQEGELQLYREAEGTEVMAGRRPSGSSPSATSASPATSVSSQSFSSSSSFASSVAIRPPELPARSHLLMLGERSPTIAAATFFPAQEPVYLRTVKVKLKDKIDAIQMMYLLDSSGRQLTQLSLDTADTEDKTWKGTLESGVYSLPKSQNTILAVEALLKERGSGGSSERIVQVDTFTMSVQGEWSGSNYESAPVDTPVHPKHQTAQARVTEVRNMLANNDVLPVGANQLLGAFEIKGITVPGALLLIEHLEFQISKSSSIAVNNWQLGTADSSDRIGCSVNGTTLSCLNIPTSIGDATTYPRVLRVFGNVALDQGANNYFLQLILNQPGVINENGAVRWSDGSGHFTWTELSAPIARGTLWK
jgi:hypothetical protein